MSGATGVEDVGTKNPFEKATLKLHCMFCGDTMFTVSVGRYACIGCNVWQEIVLRFGEYMCIGFEDEIVPEEIHIVQHLVDIDVDINFPNEVVKRFKK